MKIGRLILPCLGLALWLTSQNSYAEDKADPLFPMAANLNGKCGFIDRTGRFVIPPRFSDATSFQGNETTPVKLAGKTSFINRQGRVLLTLPKGVEAFEGSQQGIYRVHTKDGTQFLNQQGKPISPDTWEFASPFSDIGLADVKRDNKVGFIDRTGNLVLPLKWDDAGPFSYGGLAPAQISGRWGLIDRTGNWVIAPSYGFVYDFGNGYFEASRDVEKFLIDGRTSVATVVASTRKIGDYTVSPPNQFGFSLAEKVEDDFSVSQRGIMDRDGRWIAPPRNWEIYLDDRDPSRFILVRNGKTGYIDSRGKIVIAPVFELAQPFEGREFAFAEKAGKSGLIDRDGRWVVAPKFKHLGRCVPLPAPMSNNTIPAPAK